MNNTLIIIGCTLIVFGLFIGTNSPFKLAGFILSSLGIITLVIDIIKIEKSGEGILSLIKGRKKWNT